MKPVIFHPEAEAEFRAAIAYYNEQRPGLGAEFQTEVEKTVRRTAQRPQASSP